MLKRFWSVLLLALVSFWLALALPIAGGGPLGGEAHAGSPGALRRHAQQSVHQAQVVSPKVRYPVKVGIYVENYHDVSLKDRSFVAEGYYWYKWSPALNETLAKLDIPPSDLLEISNTIGEWDSAIVPMYEKPIRLDDGSYYMQIRFSANFYIPQVHLHRSPFESLVLPLVLEVRPNELAEPQFYVGLQPERLPASERLYGADAEIDGYRLAGVKPVVEERSYGSSLGLGDSSLVFSAVSYQAEFVSSVGPGILLWVLPVVIVTLIVIISPSIEGSLGDIRIAIPSTGLLTLIFLQQGYRDTLPPLDYLTFLDWIYACAYVISLGIFVLFLWSTNLYHRTSPDHADAVARRVKKVDLIAQVTSISALVAVGILAWVY